VQSYTIVSGDTLSGIAARHGLDWRADIYDHPANAAFKESHPNPDLIYPGDVVYLPGPEEESTPERYKWTHKVTYIHKTLGVQQRLNHAGFDAGPNDGISGPQTSAGITSFQRFCADNCNSGDPRITDAGPVDGIYGPLTQAALQIYFGC
jgi:hypothetical protein